jgi:hypothetical protein
MKRSLRAYAGYATAVLACGLVFMAYLKPELMVTLAQQLWACF